MQLLSRGHSNEKVPKKLSKALVNSKESQAESFFIAAVAAKAACYLLAFLFC